MLLYNTGMQGNENMQFSKMVLNYHAFDNPKLMVLLAVERPTQNALNQLNIELQIHVTSYFGKAFFLAQD